MRTRSRFAWPRAENAALRSADGAIDVLRNIYRDESAPRSDRIKAANGAIAYEQPKILPQPAPLDLVANDPDSTLPLAELVRRRRARQDALENLPLDDPRRGKWRDESVLPSPSRSNGNGSDDTAS
jgi:hypothetical protein